MYRRALGRKLAETLLEIGTSKWTPATTESVGYSLLREFNTHQSQSLLRSVPARSAHGGICSSHLGKRSFVSTRLNNNAATERVRSMLRVFTRQPKAIAQKGYSLVPSSVRNVLESLQRPTSLRRAMALQIESIWQRHYRKIFAAALVLIAYGVWRTMRATAAAFVDVSQSLAVTGLSSLSATIAVVAVALLYRRHFVISPNAVYRAALLRLNTHPGILEIMGAPLTGSSVQATVVTGGGLKIKGLRPKLRSRRVHMLFPLRGTDRRGLVSVEAKKKGGQLKMSLLAVDVPMPASLGGEQRVYVEGGPRAYARGNVLDELRKPFLAALGSQESGEAEDEAEDEAEARQKEAAAITALPPSPGPGSTGTQQGVEDQSKAYSRAYAAAKEWVMKLTRTRPGL